MCPEMGSWSAVMSEQTPDIWVNGASANQRRLIVEACERVFELLPTGAPMRVEVGDDPSLDPMITLRASDEGIWIQRTALGTWPSHQLQYYIYEEASHFAIGHRGLPHAGGVDVQAFLQELFAGYVQYTLFARHNGGDLHRINFFAIAPDSHAYYSAGKHVGYALAGATRSDELLQEMLDDPRFDPALKELTKTMRASLRASSAAELAEDLVTTYETLAAG